jgi:hypothetical protein
VPQWIVYIITQLPNNQSPVPDDSLYMHCYFSFPTGTSYDFICHFIQSCKDDMSNFRHLLGITMMSLREVKWEMSYKRNLNSFDYYGASFLLVMAILMLCNSGALLSSPIKCLWFSSRLYHITFIVSLSLSLSLFFFLSPL